MRLRVSCTPALRIHEWREECSLRCMYMYRMRGFVHHTVPLCNSPSVPITTGIDPLHGSLRHQTLHEHVDYGASYPTPHNHIFMSLYGKSIKPNQV